MGKTERIIREIRCITDADHIILNYLEHNTVKNRVNLHYYHADWQPGGHAGDCNLGDYLSKVIVQWMCDENGFPFDRNVETTHHLYAVGSILQMGYQNATVWGTGFAFEMSRFRAIPHKRRKLDIRCVRGPKTRETLKRMGYDCPQKYGDPGVLMPKVYKPKSGEHTEYVIIPHFQVEECLCE